jgi:hypothetical protein
MRTALILLFMTSWTHAYTLNNNFGAAFENHQVKVKVAGDTTCLAAKATIYELSDHIDKAIHEFWNRVPTSGLRLTNGGFTDSIPLLNTGRLCAPTDDTCLNEANAATDPNRRLIPPVDEIVIACNDNTDNYGGGNVIAVTIPNKFSGRKIKGAIILINNSSTVFANLSDADRSSVIAHEIGHAIGLGHSEDKSALMYFRTVNQRKSLGQDDVDGVSYLYPVKVDACGLLGTIDTNKANPQMWQMGIGFLMMILLLRLKRLLYRS